jgi:hypothetical protein
METKGDERIPVSLEYDRRLDQSVTETFVISGNSLDGLLGVGQNHSVESHSLW